MAMQSPITITLYDSENEGKSYQRSFVAYGVMKQAVLFAKENNVDLDNLDISEINPELFDQMAAVVCAAFGDVFTIEDLNKNASVEEVMAALQNIFARAASFSNPTKPGR
jgi:hypothetical protein